MKKCFALVALLLPFGSAVVFSDGTDLLGIVLTGSLEDIRAAIERGGNVNATGEDGMTPLIAAARYNDAAIGTLLEAGADANAHDTQFGATALMWVAAYAKMVEPVRALLAAGAEVEARDKDGGTAVMWAAAHNPNVNVLAALIERGANLGARTRAGLTALIMAARGNGPAIVGMLLDAGADAKVKDSYGNTALSYARYNSQLANTSTLRRLEEISR